MLNKTTEYIYDNWQVIEECSGANVKSFVYGDYIDEVVYNETDGVGYYPLRGVNYNIEALTNSSGDLVETYAIDAFGNFKVFDAAGVEKAMSDRLNSILFQGREYDGDVGMYYFRNRWYSAELGRFITRDPLRYGAGDVNLYRFVGNDPVNNLDPMGLWSLSLGAFWKFGGIVTVGYDEKLEKGFASLQVGVGFGATLSYDSDAGYYSTYAEENPESYNEICSGWSYESDNSEKINSNNLNYFGTSVEAGFGIGPLGVGTGYRAALGFDDNTTKVWNENITDGSYANYNLTSPWKVGFGANWSVINVGGTFGD